MGIQEYSTWSSDKKKKKKATTISLVTTNGPSINTIVNPAPKLVNNGNDQPAYLGEK